MTTSANAPLDLLTTEEAAAILRQSPSTLRYWRSDKKTKYGPRHSKQGKRVLYRHAELVRWVNEQEGLEGF